MSVPLAAQELLIENLWHFPTYTTSLYLFKQTMPLHLFHYTTKTLDPAIRNYNFLTKIQNEKEKKEALNGLDLILPIVIIHESL